MKTIIKAFKFRLKPSKAVIQKFVESSRACAFIWNKALSLKKSDRNYINNELSKRGYKAMKDEGEKKELKKILYKKYSRTYADVDRFLNNVWKKSDKYGFLKNPPSHVLQQKLIDFKKANDLFNTKHSKGVGFPRKKDRNELVSFRFPEHFKIDEEKNTVYIPKISKELGPVKYINSRKIEGKQKNLTITNKCGHWYMSVQVEIDQDNDGQKSKKDTVGIDLGVNRFATCYNGNETWSIDPINPYKNHQKTLASLQRKLKNKEKKSNNTIKLRKKISKLHNKIYNIRNDFLQKESTKLCNEYKEIIIEDLKIKNMTKSAKGTIENPGKNVKQKAGLNKTIQDQAWSKFVNMLEYKQQWNGFELKKVDPKNTSLKCSVCGYISKENRTSQSKFLCVKCGHESNADDNASVNIFKRGGTTG